MDVSSIRVYSNSLGTPVLSLDDLPVGYEEPYIELSLSSFDLTNKFIVKSISGLEPPDISAWSSARSNNTNFGALTPREIGILLTLNPNNSEGKTVSQLRDELYRLINSPGGNEIRVVFVINSLTTNKTISGSISRLETNAFSQTTEALITITCPDPIIKDVVASDMWEIATINPDDPLNVLFDDNESTAPHGIVLSVIWTNETPGYFRMTTHHPNLITTDFEVEWFLNNGEVLYINSQYGELNVTKYAGYLGDGEYEGPSFNVGTAIKLGSVWPTAYPGLNSFYFPNMANWDFLEFMHTPSYWGI